MKPAVRVFSLFFVIVFLFSFTAAAFAESAETDVLTGGLYVDGAFVESGRREIDGVEYAVLADVAEALGAELTVDEEENGYSFPWRKSEAAVIVGASEVTYMDTERELDGEVLLSEEGEEVLVPLESFCRAIDVSWYYDAEYDTVYCTPGAGDWPLPEGYPVPVLMYHGIGHGGEKDNLFIEASALEDQIVWLLDNGFTPIWFEDLWHVEDFEKPVILVFDDGWYGIYRHLFPLTEKYQVKAVAAVVEEITEHRTGKHVEAEHIVEMAEAGLIAFESHGVTHQDVSGIPMEQVEPELRDSELWLTRLVKKEPCAFIYPIGGSTPAIQELVKEYYHFAAKMMGRLPWTTSDDPTLVYRYFVERQTTLWEFGHWMTMAFENN